MRKVVTDFTTGVPNDGWPEPPFGHFDEFDDLLGFDTWVDDRDLEDLDWEPFGHGLDFDIGGEA